MSDTKSRLGKFADNPARQDVEEIGQIIGIHYAINAILNEHKQIVHILAGKPDDVIQAGIPLANQIYLVPSNRYDLMIVSPGGHPKDINLYQTQKALAHARQVTQEGGTIVLIAECIDGTGSDKYEKWVRKKRSHQEVINDFQIEGFQIGSHKAYQISRDAIGISLLLMSAMKHDFVRSLLLEPVEDLQKTISNCIHELSLDSKIGIMPSAITTIPYHRC